jgi:DNA-binding GntR family transcriptional regulator
VAGATVDKAVRQLKDEGLVHTVMGMGIYVAGRPD